MTTRLFQVRLAPGGFVHLCDADAHTGGQTLCGKRWWYRVPVWDPYADPYAQSQVIVPCPTCQEIAATLAPDPAHPPPIPSVP